ncbi:hypothetical protein GTR04_6303 [Trichophyton interdigitale]|uniref:Uncharacterized protein n=3 Tax=Trichophyton TaxID=5550 RepID=A0A9P4YG94_9EURO|nr:hypothetical protein TESG_08507 [Trichophyton tonsurans CBS 112818]EGE09418.1 hypothetical protein TEQG_08848 [Trichophyton equinum CBS 127.97]KAF3892054.1 hypothetical protein GY632_4838 [Trichophyton interdigitale]KAF3893249.1 hypothetical protein GY631_3785 [Trichophyton interdigitale]KAG8206322.1 hypothetical protein GTR04_6303 [Trichophyton interdigitale]
MVRVDRRSEGGNEGCRLEIEAVVGLKLAMVDREVVDVEMRVEAGEGQMDPPLTSESTAQPTVDVLPGYRHQNTSFSNIHR